MQTQSPSHQCQTFPNDGKYTMAITSYNSHFTNVLAQVWISARNEKRTGASHPNYKDLSQLEREVNKNVTIDLITEYNDFTWECNQLDTFPSSSLETEREKLNFVVFWEKEQQSMKPFNLCSASKVRFRIDQFRIPSCPLIAMTIDSSSSWC